jgi:hypothetical protein
MAYLFPSGSEAQQFLWHFNPVFAVALFGGAMFANRWFAFLVPLMTMLVSDAVLHLSGNAELTSVWAVLQQLASYVTIALIVVLGMGLGDVLSRLSQKKESGQPSRVLIFLTKAGLIGGSSLVSSVLFFLLSNFIVWLTASETMPPAYQYPKTLGGLLECYTLALPFFGNSLRGDFYYTGLLFGGFAVLEWCLPGLKQRKPELSAATS